MCNDILCSSNTNTDRNGLGNQLVKSKNDKETRTYTHVRCYTSVLSNSECKMHTNAIDDLTSSFVLVLETIRRLKVLR